MHPKEALATAGTITLTALELLGAHDVYTRSLPQPFPSSDQGVGILFTPPPESTLPVPSETPEAVDPESATYQLKTEKNQPTSIVINGKEIPVTMLDKNVIILNYAYNPREIKPKWGIVDKHIEAPAGGSKKDYKAYAITGIIIGTDEAQITAKNPKDGQMVPLKLDRVYMLIPVSGGYVKARISGLNYEGVKRAAEIRGPNLNRFGISHDGYNWKMQDWSDIKNILAQGDQVVINIATPPQGSTSLEKFIQEKLNNGVGYEDLVAHYRAYGAIYPDGFKKLQALKPDSNGDWIDVGGLGSITVPIKP